MHRLAILTLAAAILVPAGLAFAAGGTPQPSTPRPQPTPQKSPAEEANDHYHRGLKMRDKAWKLEEKADGITDPKKKDKVLKKARKQYEKAIGEFKLATRKNAAFHQAHSSLGYALRKTGDYSSALAAYEQALALEPGYTQAIEYRAEAYLGLDRVEDAKQAYVQLATLDPDRAGELLAAMQHWVDRRQSDPGGLAVATVDEFASWVNQQERGTGQKPAAQGKGTGW